MATTIRTIPTIVATLNSMTPNTNRTWLEGVKLTAVKLTMDFNFVYYAILLFSLYCLLFFPIIT